MEKLNIVLQKQFEKMMKTGILFRTNISGSKIWEIYLKGFGNDLKFRDPESSIHNCNLCNNFIRRYGNVVAINKNNKIISIFDVKNVSEEYEKSLKEMSKWIKASKIVDVFFETYNSLNSLPYESVNKRMNTFQLGVKKNVKRYTKEEAEKFGVVKPNEIRTFHHFNLQLDKAFVDMSGKSIEAIMSKYRSDKEVFKRAMDEIPLDTLMLVRDLIKQGSLLDGETHLHKIEAIIPLKEKYDTLSTKEKDNWCWVNSYGFKYAKFRNELIGVLCVELAEGEELNKACQTWNKRVDPANYMKATAPITEAQKKRAQEFVEENGYTESFDRRHANIDDIKVSEILHSNVGDGKIKSVSIFDDVKTTSTRHKRNEFKGVEEVTIDKFMKDILPGVTSIEAFVENKHEGNFVSLTTSKEPDAKQIFNWNNPFSWTYKGNLAGKSLIKEAVKSQGGKVDGVLRFSIMWSEGDSKDNSDLDAHCITPDRFEIYYSSKLDRTTGGNLDIDITQPLNHKREGNEVVENITFPSMNRLKDGVYKFFVHQYAADNSQGFKAEIEFNGEIHQYEYNRPVRGNVQVAEVTVRDGQFSIVHKLPATTSSKDVYGIETQKFHKVNLVCLSPNHWGNNKTGNKHYFFILDSCATDKPIRGFHIENLLPELREHRKVLEVLSAVHLVEPITPQLSGLGFNATIRDEVILRLRGSHKRVIKVKF